MKFSILVPVYNVEKYLEQCVESLLNQTFKGEYEIILVDDGSTDSSGRICDSYAEKYQQIRVVHKKNEGLVSARQAGIAVAQGEYSLFVDSDDFVENNLLQTVADCIERNNNPDTVIYSFRYYSDGKTRERKTVFCENETVFEGENKKGIYETLLFTTHITALWIKAVKTDILKSDTTDYSHYYDKNMAEDWFRSIPLLTAAKKIVYLNKPIYNYRTNEASISRSFRPETIEKKNILYVYERLREYLPVWGMDTPENRQKLSARWLSEVMYTFGQYYENVSRKDRKAVLEYDWSSMLPEEAEGSTQSPYENKVYRKIYSDLKNKNFVPVRLYFFKKRIRKFIKKLLNRGS